MVNERLMQREGMMRDFLGRRAENVLNPYSLFTLLNESGGHIVGEGPSNPVWS